MRPHLLLGLFLSTAVLLPSRIATAQGDEGEDSEEKAAKHFAEGRKLYQEGKYKEAITELLKAFSLRPAPPILLNVARTYEKLGDNKNALLFYKRFLLKARLVDPSRPMVEQVVRKLEGGTQPAAPQGKPDPSTATAAGSKTEPGPGPTTTPPSNGEPPTAATAPAQGGTRVLQVIHTPVDSAKVRTPVTIIAELPPEVTKAKLWVYFRRGGESRFRHLELGAQGEAFVVRIPARYLTSTSLQYFLEAKNENQTVARAGSKHNPQIIVVEGGRAPNQPGRVVELRSPYRTWIWVGAASGTALLGGSLAMALLAKNRASAMEDLAQGGSAAKTNCGAVGICSFDQKARAFESEGKKFATAGGVLLGVGIAALGATGVMWYLDHTWLKRKRAELASGTGKVNVVRFSGAPWANEDGGGFVGRIDF
jgi:hypothetical protein